MITPEENGKLPASLMTKREMIAAQIFAAIIPIPNDTVAEQARARLSVKYADILLNELSKE